MTGADWIERLAVSLIMVPTIMFCIPIWAALNRPALLLEQPQVFLLFLALPYAAGIALWLWARKLRRAG
ncbi:MAG: hypothetical protein V4574_03090 [Pseudomonadota bacterium]